MWVVAEIAGRVQSVLSAGTQAFEAVSKVKFRWPTPNYILHQTHSVVLRASSETSALLFSRGGHKEGAESHKDKYYLVAN